MDIDAYLRQAYVALRDEPLDPTDPRYVPIYQHPLASTDPVKELADDIDFQPLDSVHLFSGFVGSGKSTELRRLERRLAATGRHKVVLCDMQDYLNLTTPVDVSDVLLGVAGAFSEALAQDPDLLGSSPMSESYFERFVAFLQRTQVEVPEVGVELLGAHGAAQLKTSLKQDPTFKQHLQESLAGRLGALVDDVRAFMADCVKALRKQHGADTQVVLMLDSMEQIQGTTTTAEQVQASVERLFATHRDKLRFDDVHVVYTVPPWLKVRAGGLGARYTSFQLLPCVKICTRDGQACAEGRALLTEVITKRFDWRPLLDERDLALLVEMSGGYLRELLRMVRNVVVKARGRSLPVPREVVELVVDEARNEYLPIAEEDAAWLRKVQATRRAELGDAQRLPRLATFSENHLVMGYRNGQEWFDVHPLLRERLSVDDGGAPTPP